MGNSSSSSGRTHADDSADCGALSPYGVYTGARDWNHQLVTQFIVARKLAPFYRPLDDYDESWDDDQILAARKEFPTADTPERRLRHEQQSGTPPRQNKRPAVAKEPSKPEASVYRGAVECPICFLYYPPNINRSRCCDQAICTECFVQIKRIEPTTTHLVSEPAACPYCVQDNFGVVYTPPPWRAGIGSEGPTSSISEPPRGSQSSVEPSPPYATRKRRQKSFSADSPEVVTTDHIRPDWEAKLAAVRATAARRANRRIIMRQVGDRLIPVGVTSGRVHTLSAEEAAAESGDSGSRRSRRRQHAQQQFEQFMGMGGQDLEELMLMEAMRLSLLDHEEQQRKALQEKEERQHAAAASKSRQDPGASSSRAGVSSFAESSSSANPPYSPPFLAPIHPDLASISDLFDRTPLPPPPEQPLFNLSPETVSAHPAGSLSTGSLVSADANSSSIGHGLRDAGGSTSASSYGMLSSASESSAGREPLLRGSGNDRDLGTEEGRRGMSDAVVTGSQ